MERWPQEWDQLRWPPTPGQGKLFVGACLNRRSIRLIGIEEQLNSGYFPFAAVLLHDPGLVGSGAFIILFESDPGAIPINPETIIGLLDVLFPNNQWEAPLASWPIGRMSASGTYLLTT